MGRETTSSIRTPSHKAPTSSSTAAMLAATSALALSATNATRSPGWMPRHTSTALRAPGARSAEGGPNTDMDIGARAWGLLPTTSK